MKMVNNEKFIGERAEFFAKDVCYLSCSFFDGESPLKESDNVILNDCEFGWKYPLWYSKNATAINTVFTENARSGIWYAVNITADNCTIRSPKLFRRCKGVTISDTTFLDARETLWTCENVHIKDVDVKGDYFGMNCKCVEAENLHIDGNYCFDGAENLRLSNCVLNSKDSFWNVKNAVVTNSTIIGEYIGWNSENLTFINCRIESHQGLCYIKGLKMVNCTLVNSDLTFEYCSDIDADIIGRVDSVKNPLSGRIVADEFGEIILEKDKVDTKAIIVETRK